MDYINQMWDMATAWEDQGVAFFSVLYLFVVMSASAVMQIRTRYWKRTEGELVSKDVDVFSLNNSLSEQQYTNRVQYTYTVGGQRYNGKRLSPWQIVANHNAQGILKYQLSKVCTLPNGKIIVHYNPSNPEKSFLLIAGKAGIVVTLLIAVVPFLLYLRAFHF